MKTFLLLIILSSWVGAAESPKEKMSPEVLTPEEALIPDFEQDPYLDLKQSLEEEKYNQNNNQPTWSPEEQNFNKNRSNEGGLF